MKKLLSFIAVMAIGAGAYTLNIQPGWQLKGTFEDINISSLNNSNIKSVWAYDANTKKWKAYLPNSSVNLTKYNIGNLTQIKKDDGFWVNASNSFQLNIVNNEYNNSLFNNITYFSLDAASSAIIGDNKLQISNLRVKSDDLDTNDSITISYTFDPNTMKLIPDWNDTHIYKNIGIYNDDELPLFVKDVKHNIYLTYKDSYGDHNLSMGKTYTMKFSKDINYTCNLQAGQIFSFSVNNSDDDYTINFYNSKGEKIDNFEMLKSTGVISGGIPILENGKLIIKVIPKHNQNLTCDFKFLNANRRDLKQLENGDDIDVSLMENVRDYAKYKIALMKGEKLILPAPDDGDMELALLNKNGKIVYGGVGVPLVYTADNTGNFYLFIYNKKGWGGSYSGTVEIKSPTTLNRKKSFQENKNAKINSNLRLKVTPMKK